MHTDALQTPAEDTILVHRVQNRWLSSGSFEERLPDDQEGKLALV